MITNYTIRPFYWQEIALLPLKRKFLLVGLRSRILACVEREEGVSHPSLEHDSSKSLSLPY